MSVFIGYPSFMAYQMMKGKKGNNEGFPPIPGTIARYSALGITNEEMSKNPVWVDKTGNGHDLQMKNFAWSGMSGVGGYKFNFLSNEWFIENLQVSKKYSYKIVINNKRNSVQLYNRINLGHIKITLKITGIEINKSKFRVYDNVGMEHAQNYTKDGIYEIDYTANEGANLIYFYVLDGNMGQLENPITIEQLPLYPGFILGDGVDDFAVTEKELNFKDTYTVYTAFIPFQDDPTRTMALCGKDRMKDFYLYYPSLDSVGFFSADKSVSVLLNNGFNLIASKRTSDKMVIKNIITGKSSKISANILIDNPGLYYLWRSATITNYAKAAILGQTICNGYFSTDEDDEKVLDWYKKQYPWLFPDQAWTVTGKTNEDEDRATIANITGNGNDLVLSNFGFAEGSGYGLYAYNFNSFNLKDNVVKPTDVKKDSFRMIGTGNSINVPIILNESDSADWKIRITGMKEGDSCIVGNANKSGDYIKIIKDGIYTFQKQYAATSINGIWYNSSQEVDVLVEQIPEYEGYLVTDGVDDIASSNTVVYEADFTFIGEWKFIQKDNTVAGINSVSHLYIQNRYNRGATVMIDSTFENKKNITDYMTFKAITSKGKGYDENWNEVDLLYCDGNKGPSQVSIGGQGGSDFCHMIFKNMALYMNKVFSKDECIKAYNYLQTLKAK